MPTWWIVGLAIYVPLFLVATAARVRAGDDAGEGSWGSVIFLGLSTVAALFWFG
jgi:hypothetical protein